MPKANEATEARTEPPDVPDRPGPLSSRAPIIRSTRDAQYAEDWVDRIVEKFKYGARMPCARVIWKYVRGRAFGSGELAKSTNEALAAKFAISPSVVSRGISHGSLSFDNLIVILTELKEQFHDLPDMPPRSELALSGYANAMAFIRFGAKKRGRGPNREELTCVAMLLTQREAYVLLAQARCGAGSADARAERWRRLDARIIQRAKESLGVVVRPRGEPEYLQVIEDWAESWSQCWQAVPYQWLSKPWR